MALTWWELALLAAAGTVSGYLNVLAGGGSLLTLPVMVFLGMPGPVANGTNRIGILAQNIVAVATFARRGFREFRLSATLSLCALPGAIAGAWFGTTLDGVWFNRVLALVMLLVMLVMATDRKPIGRESRAVSQRRLFWGHLSMVGLGFYGGFIQIGIGLLLMPVLHRVMGMDLVRVNAHKVFIVGCYTVVALAVFAARVEILWIAGLALAAGNMLGGWLGAHFTVTRGEKLIRWTLNAVLLAMITKLLLGEA